MFRNYMLIAARSVLKNRIFSFISVGGLAVSLAAAGLIILYVADELSYDNWIPGAEKLYRVENTIFPAGRDPVEFASTQGFIGDYLLSDYPAEIEESTRLITVGGNITRDSDGFAETFNYVDQNFFGMFQFEALAGDLTSALDDTNSAVITRQAAVKYFGGINVIGQVLTVQDFFGAKDLEVAAVVETLPANSHFANDIFVRIDPVRMETVVPNFLSGLTQYPAFTYVKIDSGAARERVEADFANFADRHNIKGTTAAYVNVEPHDFIKHQLINVRDIYLQSLGVFDMKPHGRIGALYGFMGIAALLIIAAIINFVNLSTARSAARSREVAMRRTLGANRKQIITQFMTETSIYVLASLMLAMVVIELALPWFNTLLNKDLALSVLASTSGAAGVLAGFAILSLFSGLYPALHLSQVRPARVLRANQSGQQGSGLLRMILVLAQFAVTVGLIASTFVLYSQTDYVNRLELGFEADDVAIIRTGSLPQPYEDSVRLKNELERLPGVRTVTISGQVPMDTITASYPIFAPATGSDETISTSAYSVDGDFFEAFNVPVLAGRTFSEDFGTDQLPVFDFADKDAAGAVILNQSAVAKFGYSSPQDALGEIIRMTRFPSNYELTIVGVVQDFHVQNAFETMQPLVFVNLPAFMATVSVKTEPGALFQIQDAVETLWKDMFPGTPLTREFLTENIAAQYEAVTRQGQILIAFALLTVAISCLGVYGLSAFMAEQRAKEVGIRKVMGAEIPDILKLFIWRFLKPVLLANLIGIPIAWLVMGEWLQGFAYRIDMGLMPFAFAAAITALFASATVAGRVYRAASRNPVYALRYE